MENINLEHIDKNSLFVFLNRLSENSSIPLSKCKHCNGTGLSGVYKMTFGFSWSGGECEYCHGTGFDCNSFENLIFICDNCNGSGCSKCNNHGFLDWLQNLRG